jgi:hypothetical protein
LSFHGEYLRIRQSILPREQSDWRIFDPVKKRAGTRKPKRERFLGPSPKIGMTEQKV